MKVKLQTDILDIIYAEHNDLNAEIYQKLVELTKNSGLCYITKCKRTGNTVLVNYNICRCENNVFYVESVEDVTLTLDYK